MTLRLLIWHCEWRWILNAMLTSAVAAPGFFSWGC